MVTEAIRDQFHDEPLHDWLEAYVLGALDQDERDQFEDHLPDCEVCRADLAAHIRMVDLLTYSLPPQQPPSEARDRLLTRIHAERDGPPATARVEPTEDPMAPRGAVGSAAVRPPARHPRRIKLSSLLAGAALVVLLGLGALVGLWGMTGPHASVEVEVTSRLPGGRVLPLTGTGVPTASGRLFVVNGTRAELVVEGLPVLPQGRAYQVWFSETGQPMRSGGVFAVNSQGVAVSRPTIPAPLERITAIAVTHEPAPGSTAPTSIPLLDWTPTGPPAAK